MEKSKKYTPISIPPRKEYTVAERVIPVRTDFADTQLLVDTTFAEIEVEHGAVDCTTGEVETRLFSPAASAQPVKERTIDPVRERFYQMRDIVSKSPFTLDNSGLFYRQAKFMENFSDEYSGNEPFSMYYPYYQHMGYEQLRTYFSWRAKVRSGEYQRVSLSYVFLYIYELLSNIGVNSAADGLDKLMTVWNTYRGDESALDQYLPQWLKDYHIYYELPNGFAEFVSEHGLQRHYPELILTDANTENSLTLWNAMSDYDVTKSKFWGAGYDLLLSNCFSAVLRAVEALCTRRHIRLEDLLIYNICEAALWRPFQRALFYPWLWQPDRWVEMPGREVYYCENNVWTADIPILYSDRNGLAGYIIKKVESCLRQAVKYKYNIKIGGDYRFFRRLKKSDISPMELDQTIEKAVADFYRDLTRTVVTVDHGNLARIRIEALTTMDKLLVPDEETLPLTVVAPTAQNVTPEQSAELSRSRADGWGAFSDALSDTERKALSMISRGSVNLKAFADEHGVMLEVLADSINEKATDHIGDSILEMDECITIFDEYKEKVAEAVMK